MRDTLIYNASYNFLSSLLSSFAGGNSKETIQHFVPHVKSSMHVLCLAHVWSVQMFNILIKYGDLLEGVKNMEWDAS